jgi:hypothetical protein
MLASVMLLAGLPWTAVFAQGGTGWVDPPLDSTDGQPAPQSNPERAAPDAPRTLTPRMTKPSPSAPEAAPPRISRPSVVEPSALEPEPTRRRISRPRVVEPRPVAEPEPTRPRTRLGMVEPSALKPEPSRLRLTRPNPQHEPAPALRRARVPVEEIGEVVVAPAPRLAREHAFGRIPRPSFNCRYAKTAVERAICADPVLAAKDRRMALLYERAGGSRYRPVDPSQWSWLAARNRCGRTRGPTLERCLHAAYNDRMAELSGQ